MAKNIDFEWIGNFHLENSYKVSYLLYVPFYLEVLLSIESPLYLKLITPFSKYSPRLLLKRKKKLPKNNFQFISIQLI